MNIISFASSWMDFLDGIAFFAKDAECVAMKAIKENKNTDFV